MLANVYGSPEIVECLSLAANRGIQVGLTRNMPESIPIGYVCVFVQLREWYHSALRLLTLYYS